MMEVEDRCIRRSNKGQVFQPIRPVFDSFIDVVHSVGVFQKKAFVDVQSCIPYLCLRRLLFCKKLLTHSLECSKTKSITHSVPVTELSLATLSHGSSQTPQAIKKKNHIISNSKIK